MFAKVFTQILDSSLASDYQVRHVFEDMLKLCDINGVVNLTHDAIARRTNVPLDIVERGISELEKTDPKSQSKVQDGRRIVRLDEHRDWGWLVVNYEYYRSIASEEQRRERTKVRVERFREKDEFQLGLIDNQKTVTPSNACNAMQKQREMEKQKNKDNTLDAFALLIGHLYHRRPSTLWTKKEMTALKLVVDSKPPEEEVKLIETFYSAKYDAISFDCSFDPRRRDIVTLLNNWPGEVDKARRWSNRNKQASGVANKPDPSVFQYGALKFTLERQPHPAQFPNMDAFETCDAAYRTWLKRQPKAVK